MIHAFKIHIPSSTVNLSLSECEGDVRMVRRSAIADVGEGASIEILNTASSTISKSISI